jgi:hypothetical protein
MKHIIKDKLTYVKLLGPTESITQGAILINKAHFELTEPVIFFNGIVHGATKYVIVSSVDMSLVEGMHNYDHMPPYLKSTHVLPADIFGTAITTKTIKSFNGTLSIIETVYNMGWKFYGDS